MHIAYIAHFGGPEATTASKQPRRSKLSLQVKLVSPIYYITKFQGIFISHKMTLFPGDDKHDPLTRSAIAPLVKTIIVLLATRMIPQSPNGQFCWNFRK